MKQCAKLGVLRTSARCCYRTLFAMQKCRILILRRKQFYEIYAGNEIVSALLTQLSWTNHLLIMSGCKTNEEREFYMKLLIKEHYSSRELER